MTRLAALLLGALTFGAGCTANGAPAPPEEPPALLLGRGINLGNKLEAPVEGDWGTSVQGWMFPTIKQGGFDAVRVPTRWSAHADTASPYTIDSAFLDRVTWVVDQALGAGLRVVLNIHHYEEIFSDPAGQRERFLALWRQIATHFRAHSDSLVFEILNEPHDSLTPELWNGLLTEALATIRESNPDRYVVLGTAEWGGIGAMDRLQLPDDGRLIFTFHYYNPFAFTHQGAEWVAGSDAWLGTTWGTTQDRATVRNDLDAVAAWAARHQDIPVYLGEFGAYSRATMDARVAWTSFVAREAEQRGFSWAYWEFDAGFGAYRNGHWNELHAALVP